MVQEIDIDRATDWLRVGFSVDGILFALRKDPSFRRSNEVSLMRSLADELDGTGADPIRVRVRRSLLPLASKELLQRSTRLSQGQVQSAQSLATILAQVLRKAADGTNLEDWESSLLEAALDALSTASLAETQKAFHRQVVSQT